MKKFHIIYADDNNAMVDSVKLLFDNQEYELKKIEPLLIEVDGNYHHLVIKGEKYKNKDIETEDGEVQYNLDSEEVIWCDTGINIIAEEEYYIFKSPLFSFFKGKVVKVSKKKFEKKCMDFLDE